MRSEQPKIMVCSTGEIGLADHMRAAKRGERTMAGQELRLLDLSADAGAGQGAWESLHNIASPAGFSDALKAACAAHYGHAGPAFVRGLVADPAHWEGEAKRLVKAFVAKAKHEGDSGQVHRGALRFAAVATAGEMAVELGIVPWRSGEAAAAALTCFNAWAAGFGRTGLREHRQILECVRNAIEVGQSRFGAIPKAKDDPDDSAASNREGEPRSLNPLGYVHDIEPGKPCYLFHNSGWAEILAGFDLREAAAVLRQHGYLVPGEKGRPTRKQRVGRENRRFYTVRAKILEWDASEQDTAGGASSRDPSTGSTEWPSAVGPSESDAGDDDYGPAEPPIPDFDD